jgi:hypothetical protein
MRTPERILKDEVREYLKSIGAYFFMPVQTGYGATTLDFLVCVGGEFIGLETKAPGKKPSPRQEMVMRQMEAAGGKTFWSDDFDSIKAWFEDGS